MVSLNEKNRNAFEYFSKSIFNLNYCPDKGYKKLLEKGKSKKAKDIEAFKMSYHSNPAAFVTEIKQNTSYEKIVIEKCPTTADAFKMIEKPAFMSEFNANANAIAIVLKIDDILNEDETKKVRLLNFDAPKPRALLIAFESTVDQKLIVYWRTKYMKELIVTKLERIEIEEGLFFPIHTSVSSILIDLFLIPSIKANHNCKMLLFSNSG
jgi:hypothetical protein